MLIDKEFIKVFKYEDIKNLQWGEKLKTFEIIVSEYNKITGSSIAVEEVNDKEYLGWMMFIINVQWDIDNMTGKYTCSKLSDEYSLPFYLYSNILKNYSKIYSIVPSDILGSFMVYPDDIQIMPYNLRQFIKENNIIFSDDCDESATDIEDSDDESSIIGIISEYDENREELSNNKIVTDNKAINILWISRHPLFESQVDDLKNLYSNINLYQTRERIHNINNIIKAIYEYNISVVAVVLPDSMVIELYNRLPDNILLLKSSYAQSSIPIRSIDSCDKYTELGVFKGFERVYGYKLLTESV